MAEQIIQNPSVTPGALQIELSGGYVTAISGHPVGGTGGGSGPSVTYTGVAGEINVDNQQATIGLADAVKQQLSSIPSKVSDLSDSANYYTSAQVNKKIADIEYTDIVGLDAELNSKQNKLTFGYDDSAISSINGSAIAGQNDMSQYALKNDLDVVSGEVDILTDTSAKWNEVSAKFDTSSWNAYSGKFQLSGDYATKSDLDLYYKKTETSSKDEISDAIKDFITDADVTAKNYLTKASGDLLYVPKPEGLSDGQYYAMTTSSWKVIQGAGDVSGISTVAHDDTLIGNGNNENLGVDTTKIQTKLTDEQIQNIADVTTLKTASSTWDNVSAKLNTTDFNTYTATTAPTTYQPKGDYLSANALTNYYTKSETSGATELSTEFSKYIQTISTGVGLSGDGKTTSLGIDTTAAINLTNGSAKSATSALSADKAESAISAKWLREGNAHVSAGDVTALQHWASSNSSTWDSVTAKLTTAQYANDSASFVTSSNASISAAGEQYALTTTGWAKVQAGSTFTGVTTDVTLTGTGTDSSHKLGVAWSALSSNKIDSAKSANSAEYITNGVGYSGFNDISAKFDSLTSYVPYSATQLPIGTNNVVSNYSMGIGYANTANYGDASNQVEYGSLAFGYENSAGKMSFAAGNGNKAYHVGFAVGYHCSANEHSIALNDLCKADEYSFAEGHNNTALDWSFASRDGNYASGKSIIFGFANTAYNYSYLIGRGLAYSGASTGGYNMGAFVIGGWNATTSYATTADAPLFIIGNGASNNNKSDAFIVYRNGRVWVQGAITSNGGTFTNETVFSAATGTFDNSYIKCINNHSDGYYARFGVGSYGGAVIKAGDTNGTSPIQVNIKPTANNYELVKVERNNSTVGYLIPAVTSTTTAGLTDDGILHIIIESN